MLVTNIPSEQIPRDIKCAKPCILVNLAKDNYHSRNGDDSEGIFVTSITINYFHWFFLKETSVMCIKWVYRKLDRNKK